MTSLLMTSEIRFKVLRGAGKTSMDIFLNWTSSTHIGESTCNISEITNKKTQLQFKNNLLRGVTVFGLRFL